MAHDHTRTLTNDQTVMARFAVHRLLADNVPYETAKLSEAAELVFAVAIARLAILERRDAVVACDAERVRQDGRPGRR